MRREKKDEKEKRKKERRGNLAYKRRKTISKDKKELILCNFVYILKSNWVHMKPFVDHACMSKKVLIMEFDDTEIMLYKNMEESFEIINSS